MARIAPATHATPPDRSTPAARADRHKPSQSIDVCTPSPNTGPEFQVKVAAAAPRQVLANAYRLRRKGQEPEVRLEKNAASRYGLRRSTRLFVAADGAPRMKLQGPVTSAYLPATLTAASICLSLLLLPGGGVTAPSSGMAPALKLVAGDVVAAVKEPVHAVTRAKPKPALPAANSAAEGRNVTHFSRSAPRAHSAPAHRTAGHHRRISRRSAAAPQPLRSPVTPTPRPASSSASKAHGKARAVGHLRKTAPVPTPSNAATPSTVTTHGPVKARGRSADVPHGPPVVPPGDPVVPPGHPGVAPAANEHAAPGSRGGGR